MFLISKEIDTWLVNIFMLVLCDICIVLYVFFVILLTVLFFEFYKLSILIGPCLQQFDSFVNGEKY